MSKKTTKTPASEPAKKTSRNFINTTVSDEVYRQFQADAQKNFRTEAAQARMIIENAYAATTMGVSSGG